MLYDLLIIGITLVADLKVFDILSLLVLNPVEAARILMIQALDPSLLLLSSTGLYISRIMGPWISWTFSETMLIWRAVSLSTAIIIFNRQDL